MLTLPTRPLFFVIIAAMAGHFGTPVFIGHHGDVVDMMFVPSSGCEPMRPMLIAYNAVADTTRVLLGGSVNGGRVTEAIALGD